jgi:tRNA G10  N-methylase Trm11
MSKLIFQLGTVRELCWAEWQTVVGGGQRWSEEVALVESEEVAAGETDLATVAKRWMEKLGGVVKIAQVVAQVDKKTTSEDLAEMIADHLAKTETGKIYFAVSEIGRDHLPKFEVSEVKARLQAKGRLVRFNDRARRSAPTPLLLKRKLREILLVQGGASTIVAETLAVQDIDEWTRRDRGKPYADHKKGMLPPKLARIMVNLARGKESEMERAAKQPRLYDPFCGTGTILLEAAMMGMAVVGSDLDARAVQGTQENLAWLAQSHHLALSSTALAKDVTQITPAEVGGMVEMIVTEPFLGRQTPRNQELDNIFRGLSKMYWGAFRHWRELLTDGGRVVIVMPRVTMEGKTYSLESLLDKIKALGYTKRPGELIYARPGAIVQREIAVFDYRLQETERI